MSKSSITTKIQNSRYVHFLRMWDRVHLCEAVVASAIATLTRKARWSPMVLLVVLSASFLVGCLPEDGKKKSSDSSTPAAAPTSMSPIDLVAQQIPTLKNSQDLKQALETDPGKTIQDTPDQSSALKADPGKSIPDAASVLYVDMPNMTPTSSMNEIPRSNKPAEDQYDKFGKAIAAYPSYPDKIQTYSPGGTIKAVDRTWIVIHGRNASRDSTYIKGLLAAIASRPKSQVQQVLSIDWSEIANSGNFIGEQGIETVASFVVLLLKQYGFKSNQINLVGHSWGGDLAGEIAERFPQGVNTIVALDPARNTPVTLDLPFLPSGGTYNPDTSVDFGKYSKYSLLFRATILASSVSPVTADTAVVVKGTNHDGAVTVFTHMLYLKDPVSSRFSLATILNAADKNQEHVTSTPTISVGHQTYLSSATENPDTPKPWQPDQFAADGEHLSPTGGIPPLAARPYEAVLSISKNNEPQFLIYYNSQGQRVLIKASDPSPSQNQTVSSTPEQKPQQPDDQSPYTTGKATGLGDLYK